MNFCSVQLSDDGVDIRTAESGISKVFKETGFVSGSMTRHRQPERQQEVVGRAEALANRVDFMDQVLQADDAMFS